MQKNVVTVARKQFSFLPPFSQARSTLSGHSTLAMNSLLIPPNEATLRLEQAFQLIFQTSPPHYAQLCRAFLPLGGLPRAWLVKGESGSGMALGLRLLDSKDRDVLIQASHAV